MGFTSSGLLGARVFTLLRHLLLLHFFSGWPCCISRLCCRCIFPALLSSLSLSPASSRGRFSGFPLFRRCAPHSDPPVRRSANLFFSNLPFTLIHSLAHSDVICLLRRQRSARLNMNWRLRLLPTIEVDLNASQGMTFALSRFFVN